MDTETDPADQQFTGKFCWDEIEGFAIPFIIRSSGEMMAEINMLKKTIFKKHLEVLKKSVFDIACPPVTQISRVTVSERRLLNEINAVHCDYYFSRKSYTSDAFLLTKDQVIKLHQVLQLFHKVVTERSIENPDCGYIRIVESNTPVPFVDIDDLGLVVPLFFFECPAVMHMKIELEDHWSLAYLKLFCKLLSIHDVFYDHPTLMVVELDRLKDVIPEAGQLTLITKLPSNAKLSEISKYTIPVKRRCLKATEGKSSYNSKRLASELDNSSTADIIILSDPDNNCDSRDALETITIQIESENTTSTNIRKTVQQRKQVRKQRRFRKMLSLHPKTAPSADNTNSGQRRVANNQSKSNPKECTKKAAHSKQRIDSNTISVNNAQDNTYGQEMEMKQSKQVRQKRDHRKSSNSIDDTSNNQSIIEPRVNKLTPLAVKRIQISDPSLIGNFKTCTCQTENTPLEQNSLISNTQPSLSNDDSGRIPCFGFLSQAPSGIMSKDFLQAHPSLDLSGTNSPLYVITPRTELMSGPASSPGIFLASGQPIAPPSPQKPNETHSVIGTQEQPVDVQQAGAHPPSINVGISNSIVILQPQGQRVENLQQIRSSITEFIGNSVQQVGLLPPQSSNVSQQNGVFLATEAPDLDVQAKLRSPKGTSTLSGEKVLLKKSKESIKERPRKKTCGEQEFITVFEKEPPNQFWALKAILNIK